MLYVSSRFEGRVYRVFDDGRYEVMASDLGVACGLAFGADGSLYVGDRRGSMFRIDRKGRTETFASMPSSIAAFHLAMSPDGDLLCVGADAGVVRLACADRSRGPRRGAEHALRPAAGTGVRCQRRAARRRSARRIERRLCDAARIASPSWSSPAPAWSAWRLVLAARWSSRRTTRSIRSRPA